MKKWVWLLSLMALMVVFVANCTTINERYTGKRIQTEPAQERDDYSAGRYYHPRYSYYDPFYRSYYDPFFWTGFSFWNPFWHYGFLGYSYYGYYSPYWGYNRGYYSYRGTRYYKTPYYKTYIRKGQLKRNTVRRPPQNRRRESSTKTRITTSVRSRSLGAKRSVSRSRSGSSRVVKKKKR